ncbi:Acetyl-coenzyme A carboxyl transferase alpha chain / Acetyl-coenzyme A carboxyl transferase beta chain; Propionyl-CoA carboxylase beta chain [invertebrate metagenome]|uniref:Acetyl-coenzyme A carboxyl transferase alpha chain / Acetyl-coenzyme A carboxyl transferase beta chain Propionyl-CoA carboxylase beta chain n=1 Tax=invertebrate metagenome TaxID=1711999 RepID=A0A484H6L2_9ZZZZ
MTISAKLIEALKQRREQVFAGGGEDKVRARREKGLLSARDRLDTLFEPHTFQEVGAHIKHACRHFGMADKILSGDGVVAGTGIVDGRPIAAVSQDFTVTGGTLGKMHAQKIVAAMNFAMKTGCPLIAFKDSAGARIQEGVDSLSGYGEVFYKNVEASGIIPQIAVILGPCAGGASYSPALMDFIIMSKANAHMFITGPEVIKAVTGRQCSMDEVGSATMHATVSGNVHFVADDDHHAIAIAKKLLSYLPSSNAEDPPHQPTTSIALVPDPAMNDLLPDASNEPMDVREIIAHIVDHSDFLESHAGFAQNIVTCFARIEGIVVGIIANNSIVKAGALDIDASDKGARFIRFCNCFNIPILTLVDVPGFMPGIEQERGGIIRHGAKMLFAYAGSTVPMITLILRKAYGGSYLAMCSQEMGADMVLAWPCGEIAVMGAEGAVNILYRRELSEAGDRAAKAAELVAEYRRQFASPYVAAGQGYITDVIEPGETRGVLALTLRKLLTKRAMRPPKKHGNIPL